MTQERKNGMQENKSNNIVSLVGKVLTDFEFNHKVYGEGFYYFMLEVKRLSENADCIPIIVSERIVNDSNLKVGDLISIDGQFRSYNNYGNEGNRLILTVFARNITKLEDLSKVKNPNYIYLNGFLCKPSIYRTTPFGREISDILLAVNRSYNKSDYLPCIAWGRNAQFSQNLNIGDNIKVWGRIQSREYQKRLDDGTIYNRIAYEVSISKMEVPNNKESDG